MRLEIRQPQRPGLEDEQSENAVPFWWHPDHFSLVLIEADRDEFGETGARLVQDPQRGVLRIDQFGGNFGDASQRVGQGLLGADGHHCIEQTKQLLRTGKLETIGHRQRLRPGSARL